MKNSLQIPMAVHDNYCGGYGNPGSVGNGYLLGLALGVGKTKITSQVEAHLLDRIVAFDKAEVKGTNIGQINMVTVSSFCVPMGLISWYDLAKHPNVHMHHKSGSETIRYN